MPHHTCSSLVPLLFVIADSQALALGTRLSLSLFLSSLSCDRERERARPACNDRERGHTQIADIFFNTQIFIKTLKGRSITIDVVIGTTSRGDYISHIKDQLTLEEGVPQCLQHVVFGGRELLSGMSLLHYGMRPADTLQLLLSIDSGMEGSKQAKTQTQQ
jgi:hypothetical protein